MYLKKLLVEEKCLQNQSPESTGNFFPVIRCFFVSRIASLLALWCFVIYIFIKSGAPAYTHTHSRQINQHFYTDSVSCFCRWMLVAGCWQRPQHSAQKKKKLKKAIQTGTHKYGFYILSFMAAQRKIINGLFSF